MAEVIDVGDDVFLARFQIGHDLGKIRVFLPQVMERMFYSPAQ